MGRRRTYSVVEKSEYAKSSKEDVVKSQPSDSKLLKRNSSKKKPMDQVVLDEFVERLKEHTTDMFDEQYKILVGKMYYLEEKWTHLIGDEYMTAKMKKQQECLWEFLSTERNYICKMRVIVEVFQQIFRIAQREGDLLDIHTKQIFANIDQVVLTHDTIWKDHLVKVLNKTRKKRRPLKPSELFTAFVKIDELFESYEEFCMLQDACLRRIREYSNGNRETQKRQFKVYLEFCEKLVKNERYKLVDLMTEPMQRVTRYPLLLKSVMKHTENPQERKQLQAMITSFEDFLGRINTRLRKVHEQNKLEKVLQEFEQYNTWFAGNEDVIWGCVDFLRSEISKVKEPRCILEKGNVKLIDKKGKSEMNVEMMLFTDVIVFTRRKTSTKKLVVIKQLHFLDRVKFIKSEVSATSVVVLYLDEHGLLANSMMLEMTEKDREKWMDAVSKAQDRYEKAKLGCGSTLEFFQDNKGMSDDYDTVEPPRKTSDLVNSVEVTRRASVASKKNESVSRNPSMKSITQSLKGEEKQECNEYGKIEKRRQSASWLLTDEKNVQSIRTLLREDLWGNYVNIKPSDSFRSDASDSGISLGESFQSKRSTDSSRPFRSNSENDINQTSTLTRNSSTNSISSQQSDVPEKIYPLRKISSSSMGLTGIKEHTYTEITFLSGDQITDKRQRRSVKTVPKDENNNKKITSPPAPPSPLTPSTPTLLDNEPSKKFIYNGAVTTPPKNDLSYDTPESYFENR